MIDTKKYKRELKEKTVLLKKSYLHTFMSLMESELRDFKAKPIETFTGWIYILTHSPLYTTTRPDGKTAYYRFIIRKNPFNVRLIVSTYESKDCNIWQVEHSVTVYKKRFYAVRPKNKVDRGVIGAFRLSKVTERIRKVESIPWESRASKISAIKKKSKTA